MSDPTRTFGIVLVSAFMTVVAMVILFLTTCGGLLVGLGASRSNSWVVGPGLGVIFGLLIAAKLYAIAYRHSAEGYEGRSRRIVAGLILASVLLTVSGGWLWVKWLASETLLANLDRQILASLTALVAGVAIIALDAVLPRRPAPASPPPDPTG